MDSMDQSYIVLTIEPQEDLDLESLPIEGIWERDDDLLDLFVPVDDLSDVLKFFLTRNINILEERRQDPENWNAVWESNFKPAVIGQICRIRAPFHEPSDQYETEIVLMPEMAFGTGHHPTTSMMIQMMRDMPLRSGPVLDFGTGSGVLAIYAEKRGAPSVLAIDYDAQCIRNTERNIALNNCTRIKTKQAELSEITTDFYNVILANINRSVLVKEARALRNYLIPGGDLIISGILESDVMLIRARYKEMGWQERKLIQQDDWVCMWWER